MHLTAAQLERLNRAGAPSLGFPHELLSQDGIRQGLAGGALAQLNLPGAPVA
ncbi:MAG TPA: hypothetical protein VJN44_11320 [Roseateles sp.]|nr:hypothetical protein [Roseateles sp.]